MLVPKYSPFTYSFLNPLAWMALAAAVGGMAGSATAPTTVGVTVVVAAAGFRIMVDPQGCISSTLSQCHGSEYDPRGNGDCDVLRFTSDASTTTATHTSSEPPSRRLTVDQAAVLGSTFFCRHVQEPMDWLSIQLPSTDNILHLSL